jgi:RNA polymerase sigma factor (sigma-70 family)
MSLPERNILTAEMPTPKVSVNFAKLEDSQLTSFFYNNNRSEDAFREIIRRYQVGVFSYGCHMVLNQDQAARITQSVFVNVWKNLRSDLGNMSLKTWIYRVTSNEIIALMKMQNPNTEFDEAQTHMAESLLSFQGLSAQKDEVKLQKALCYIPFKQKLIFVLHYFQGLTFSEMAELTQTEEAVLRSSFEHSLKKIQIYLDVL